MTLAAPSVWKKGIANARLRRHIRVYPRPLVNTDERFVLIFSERAACTACTIWFFRTIGLYDEARAYNEWPHRYRLEVYDGSASARESRKQVSGDYRFIRVIRDPYQRAVSSYRTALVAGYLDEVLAAELGREVNPEKGFSFAEFLAHLAKLDMRKTNGHQALQAHPVEDDAAMDDVINITRRDLFEELNRIEAEMAMAHTDFRALDWFHTTEVYRKARIAEIDSASVPDMRLDRNAAHNGPWPDSTLFLTEETRPLIGRIYAEDFERYAAYL